MTEVFERIREWQTVDAPKEYRWMRRIGPRRWFLTVAVRRRLSDTLIQVERTRFGKHKYGGRFNAWTIGLFWFEAWWYRRGSD